MNAAAPSRSLPDGESPGIYGALLSTGSIVPAKVKGDAAFTSPPFDEPIRLAFVGEFDTPIIILMGGTKCWVQSSGAPTAKTPAAPFAGTAPIMWDGFTMLSNGLPVAVVNNRGVNLPHYLDVSERTLGYDTGDDGTGDIPDVGDTVTGDNGSVGVIMAITITGTFAGGNAEGTLTLRACTGDWVNNEVLTFEDGETAIADGVSAARPFILLANAPNMRCSIGYLGRLVGGSVTPGDTEYINRLQFSDEGDITAWSGATSGYLDMKDRGDRILRMGLLRGHQLLILRQETTYIGYPTLIPGNPIAVQHLAQRGIFARQSLQGLENAYIFMGKGDIYLADATGVVPIGWKIRKPLFRDATPSTLDRAWSFTDKRAKNYYLVVAVSGGAVAWIYNWEEKAWTWQDLKGYTMLATWRKD